MLTMVVLIQSSSPGSKYFEDRIKEKPTSSRVPNVNSWVSNDEKHAANLTERQRSHLDSNIIQA